jgi:hypothetical protein
VHDLRLLIRDNSPVRRRQAHSHHVRQLPEHFLTAAAYVALLSNEIEVHLGAELHGQHRAELSEVRGFVLGMEYAPPYIEKRPDLPIAPLPFSVPLNPEEHTVDRWDPGRARGHS